MPLYANAKSRATEDFVQEWLRDNGWATARAEEIYKTTTHPWDLECKKPKLFMAKKARHLLVEVKGRDMTWGQYPNIWLDVDKVEAITAGVKDFPDEACVGVFVVVDNNEDARFTWLIPNRITKWKTNKDAVQAGRGDSNDKADLKYEIPLIDFHTLSI